MEPATYLESGRLIDISSVPKKEKADVLLDKGFRWGEIERHGGVQNALLDTSGEPGVVMVDEWQVVLTNTPRIVPERELVIEQAAIKQLLGALALSDVEVGEDYIVKD